MWLSFWYPCLHFVQPGVLWPESAGYYPMQILGALVLLSSFSAQTSVKRFGAFSHPAFICMVLFVYVARPLSLVSSSISAAFGEAISHLPVLQFVLLSILLVTDRAALIRYVWGTIVGSMFIIVFGIYAVHSGMQAAYNDLAGAYGMYQNHNDFTFIIVQVLPFVVLFRGVTSNSFGRLLLDFSFALCLYGVLLSKSRGGILAIVLEISLLVFLSGTRKSRLLLLPLVLIIGAGAIVYQFSQRAELATEGGYPVEVAESSRYELWKAGRNMFLAHPILGVGSRRFGELGKDYYELSYDQLGKVAHNTFFEVLATTGLLGAAAFGGMLFFALREFRISPPQNADLGNCRLVRRAALIVLLTLLFRAFFDSKDQDWCFYLLVVLAASLRMLGRAPPIQGGLREHSRWERA